MVKRSAQETKGQPKRILVVTINAVSSTERAYERRRAIRTTYIARDLLAREPCHLVALPTLGAAKGSSKPEPFGKQAPGPPHFSATTLAIDPLGHTATLISHVTWPTLQPRYDETRADGARVILGITLRALSSVG